LLTAAAGTLKILACVCLRLSSPAFPHPLIARRPAPDWIHEIKLDGFRMMVRRDPAGVRLLTRNGHDWTGRFPLIAAAAETLRARSFLIDGEAVACDSDGLPVFDQLRYRRQDGRVFLYAFDLLELDGRDMRREPLEVHKSALAGVLRRMKAWAGIQLNEHCDDLPVDVAPRLQARLRGHREQAGWFTLSVGAVAGLVEDEESERTRSEARGRRGLGPMTFLARRDASGAFLPPSPPAEKANTRQHQARHASASDGAGDSGSRSGHLNEVNEARACFKIIRKVLQ
jgi:ATP dependent DNA ligase domain